MSVVSVEPISSRASTITSDFSRTYQITYRVITNNRLDGPLLARGAVPYVIGQSYVFGSEFDTKAFCLDISADEDGDDGKQWLVKCQFGKSPQLEENPLLLPWEFSLGGQGVEVPFDYDVFGTAVCNVCGDPFSTQVMRQSNQPILSITRNEASLNTVATLYANTVNSDFFYGGDPGTVMCMPVKQTRQFSATYGYYFPTTYEFVYKPEGWAMNLVNQGFRARGPRGGLLPILVAGVPITEPALLTYSGDVLPAGVPPAILTFYPYNPMPFSLLGLV